MARLKGFQKLTPVDEALNKWLNVLPLQKLKESEITTKDALNRVLSVDIIAKDPAYFNWWATSSSPTPL